MYVDEQLEAYVNRIQNKQPTILACFPLVSTSYNKGMETEVSK